MFEHRPIGLHAVGQRVGAGGLHDLGVEPVGRRGRLAGAQPGDVALLGLGEGIEQRRGQRRILLQEFVFHHDQVVDRVEAALGERRQRRLLGIADQRSDVGVIDVDADDGVDLTADEHCRQVGARARGLDVGRIHVRVDVLAAGQHPGDAIGVHAVLGGQDAAGPDPGGDGVSAVHPDPPALQIGRRANARAGVVQDRAVVEPAHQEDRQRREGDAVLTRGEVGGQRHLGDVELQRAHHPAEPLDQDRYVRERQREAGGFDRAVDEQLVRALSAGQSAQYAFRLRHFGLHPLVASNRAMVYWHDHNAKVSLPCFDEFQEVTDG